MRRAASRLFGRPPFLPFSRAAAAFFAVRALPPFRPAVAFRLRCSWRCSKLKSFESRRRSRSSSGTVAETVRPCSRASCASCDRASAVRATYRPRRASPRPPSSVPSRSPSDMKNPRKREQPLELPTDIRAHGHGTVAPGHVSGPSLRPTPSSGVCLKAPGKALSGLLIELYPESSGNFRVNAGRLIGPMNRPARFRWFYPCNHAERLRRLLLVRRQRVRVGCQRHRPSR